MKVAVSSSGNELDSQVSPVFGRCPVYLLVDTETMAFEALSNPAKSAPSGAGIQAAQHIVEKGARAVLGGMVGPNAFRVLQAAGVPVYSIAGGTVRQAVEAFKAGQLSPSTTSTAAAHTGMGWQGGPGGGRGWGKGYGCRRMASSAATAPVPQPAEAAPESGEDAVALKEEIRALQEQLDRIHRRLEQLE